MSRPAATYELTREGRIALLQAEWERLVDERQSVRDTIHNLTENRDKDINAYSKSNVLGLWEQYNRLETEARKIEDTLIDLGAKGWIPF